MRTLRPFLVPAYLLLCLVFGGASAGGFLSNLLLQWLALPLLVWALVARAPHPAPREARQLMILAGLLAALLLLQMVPLPPGLWTKLPGRGVVVGGFDLLGIPAPWLPISLAWRSTLFSAVWLLPAFAAALAAIRLGAFRAEWIAAAVLIAVVLNVLLGALQLVGGSESTWYIYQITNRNTAVGFFANGNHTADFLVVSVPLLAALYARARRRGGSAQSRSALALLVGAGFAVLVVGLVLNQSLAGLGLFVPATAASLLLLRGDAAKPIPFWAGPAVALLAAAAFAALLTAPLGNNLVGQDAKEPDSRAITWARTVRAATASLPLGTGVGTFQAIYRRMEDPATVQPVYMNHAHNDLLEIGLETGLPGLALVLLFMFWWLRQTFVLWRGTEPAAFPRAATIVTGVILAHSLVDYPLRTAGLSTLFALCCALMAQPRAVKRLTYAKDQPRARHLSA